MSDSPGVPHSLLLLAEFAELDAPRDLRGACAATAGNENNKLMWDPLDISDIVKVFPHSQLRILAAMTATLCKLRGSLLFLLFNFRLIQPFVVGRL